ncbi:DM13 domain-containing protein [Oscillatoriales cyanobacterium LEGE 11467]|uniref:DM13 domain-containing protein n=1 Tax=Zarconia navalis LEGE 11467 TaxID=1828826 RepID=A0A928VWS7_9CYAN|nr:DM13 domain-containing protein [Zarconia navalis]MBE9041571.1 DM13 domain-containing protein [Zarconia navalis LEGE 11467]
MKFNQVVSLGITSVVLFGSLGVSAIAPSPLQAKPLTSSVQLKNQTTLAAGAFVTVEPGHPTSGAATIIEKDGKRYLELSQGFDTGSGPDVQVILYRDGVVPLNVSEQDYVTLAPLESFNGGQRYEIPANIDLEDFDAVAIWCRQFNVTFGYAAFR